MVGNPNYITSKFQLIIRELKNFTNFIAELKQKVAKLKIIRHEDKEMLSHKKSLDILRKTNALLEGHFVLSSGFTPLSIYNAQSSLVFLYY